MRVAGFPFISYPKAGDAGPVLVCAWQWSFVTLTNEATMGSLSVRGPCRGERGHASFRPAFTDDVGARTSSWRIVEAEKTTTTAVSLTASDLSPTATVCHNLPHTVRIEGLSARWKAKRVSRAELQVRKHGFVTTDVRPTTSRKESGTRVSADAEKRGQRPHGPVTACHVVRNEVNAGPWIAVTTALQKIFNRNRQRAIRKYQ